MHSVALVASCACAFVAPSQTLLAVSPVKMVLGMLGCVVARSPTQVLVPGQVSVGMPTSYGLLGALPEFPEYASPALCALLSESRMAEIEARQGDAATRIQSAVRGMAERKAIKQQRALEADAATRIQPAVRGMFGRKSAAAHKASQEGVRQGAQWSFRDGVHYLVAFASVMNVAFYASVAGVGATVYRRFGALQERMMKLRAPLIGAAALSCAVSVYMATIGL